MAAEERAPPPVAAISSRVVATAVTSARRRAVRARAGGAPPARRTRRSGCRCDRLTSRPLGNSSTPAASTPGSPIRSRASASARLVAPMSIHRSSTLDTFSRSSLSMRWIAFLPTTPGHRPVAAEQPHPLSHEHLGSQPPMVSKLR